MGQCTHDSSGWEFLTGAAFRSVSCSRLQPSKLGTHSLGPIGEAWEYRRPRKGGDTPRATFTELRRCRVLLYYPRESTAIPSFPRPTRLSTAAMASSFCSRPKPNPDERPRPRNGPSSKYRSSLPCTHSLDGGSRLVGYPGLRAPINPVPST